MLLDKVVVLIKFCLRAGDAVVLFQLVEDARGKNDPGCDVAGEGNLANVSRRTGRLRHRAEFGSAEWPTYEA